MNKATINMAIAKNPPNASSTTTSSENNADGETLSSMNWYPTYPIDTINAENAIIA